MFIVQLFIWYSYASTWIKYSLRYQNHQYRPRQGVDHNYAWPGLPEAIHEQHIIQITLHLDCHVVDVNGLKNYVYAFRTALLLQSNNCAYIPWQGHDMKMFYA